MAYPVTMAAAFRTTAENLEIEYVVSNGAREPFFLINVSIRVTRDGAVAEAGRPLVELAPDGLVLLRSALRPVPRGVSYSVPPRAHAKRLEAGATEKVMLRLPLPLAPTTALPPRREPREAVFERVAFVLGVVPSSAVPDAERQEIGGVELWRLPVDAVRHQVELRAESRVANLRVLVER